MLIFSIGCQKEDLISFQENPEPRNFSSVEEIPFLDLPDAVIKIFREDNGNKNKISKRVFGSVRTDIPAVKIINEKGGESYTIALKQSKKLKSSETLFFDNIVVKANGSLRILRYWPEANWFSQKNRNLMDYTGAITFFDIDGNNLGSLDFFKGEVVPKSQNKESDTVTCVYELEDFICSGGIEGPEICVYYFDEKCTNGAPGGDSSEPIPDTGSGPNPDDRNGGTGGGVGESDSPEVDSDIETVPLLVDDRNKDEEFFLEVKVDSSFVAIDKIYCTYLKLMSTATIQKVLGDFFKDDARFNATFFVAENLICNGNDKISGCAKQLSDFEYKIEIDKDYILDTKTPTIFLAETLIHESIHANLFAAVVKYNNGIVPADTSFDGLFAKYGQQKGEQHEYMANNLQGLIKQALKEIHPLLNDGRFLNGYADNTLWDWDRFYEILAFRGLQHTVTGKEFYLNNGRDINLYQVDAETFSTKIGNCNENE